MRLTYTIEVDLVRTAGAHVPKADISAYVVNRLIEVSPQSVAPDGSVLPGAWDELGESGESEYTVREWIVYPHEGSETEY